MTNENITLFLPTNGTIAHPEVTLLIPAMNEEITIGEFVEWCKQGLEQADVKGQILIVDSSSDKTKDIALQHGAEVLAVPPKGLGQAYIDAIPYVRGKFVIMGDADLTYNMRQIKPFMKKFEEGYEFIMGSRFKGKIEPGAMPALHRYFGTPVTTWILNRVYKCHFSDIHCGMRGITLDALKRIKLQSQSWQYASEMIIKAIHLNLKSTEVPVVFHKDKLGRISHHKRIGWFAPWLAGWINLKAILTFGADFFLYKTGIVMTLLGLLGTILLSNGPIKIGKIGFQLHWMLFFLIILIAGLQFFCMGVLAKTLYDVEMKRSTKWKKIFSLNVAFPLACLYIVLGMIGITPLLIEYINLDFRLPTIISAASYHAVGGLGLVLVGIIYFTSALLFNATLLSHSQHLLAHEQSR
ncbi:MAG TPA: glycosyltransferase family 2 protein [Gammaproteobacteria bacterium]|nr:glycosyltransferase family 2 protein [Gammaproteobacteria bacterium]